MTWTYTASSHSSGNRNVLELSSGTTENDLSGLIGMTGVTHYVNENHLNVYEIDATTRVSIRGTLYHDPDTEILILHHTNAGLTNSTASTAMSIDGSSANPAFYYYGTTRTNSTRGTSTNSKSTGLIFTGARISNWHPADAIISGGGTSESFVGRGGVILTARPCTGSYNLDVIGTTWRGITSALEWRNPFGNSNGSFDGTFDGVAVLLPAFNATFKFANSSIGEVINNTSGAGQITFHTLREFDVSENINDYDIGSDGMNGYGHREYEVINSATGTDVIKMWRNTRGNTGQRGVVVVKKEVSFNIKDASGTAIEGVKLYLEDNPSSFAKNAVFLKSKSKDTTNGYTAVGSSPITRGTPNANGDMVYDYSTSEVYNKTSDASGDIAKFEVLTGVQIHEYNTSDADAATVYGMHIHNGRWRYSSSDLTQASYSDWDTSNFGNFYKVDRRSDSNTNADDFTFKFCSYGHSLSSSSQTLKGLGELSVSWVLFDDLTITESNKTTVDAYTEIENSAKFYDRAKSHLTDNYAGEGATIVARSGNEIDLGSYNLVIDATASSAFAISGTTITIKASTFTGDLTTTGTITLSNGASVLGQYTDANGTNIILPWSVTNIEAGSTLQLYNVTKDAEVVNQVVTGTAGTKVSANGTYTTSQISANDNIRLRLTCQAGTEAFLAYEAFGVATTAGISFRADQQADTVYNGNGIDGSSISTLTADYPNVQIDISDGDGSADARELYAFYVYQSTTSTGIENWFGAITAIDAMNYRVNTAVVDIKLQNTGTTALVISGARIYRDNGTSILHADTGDLPMTLDAGELVQYIAPQVDTAMNSNTKLDGVSKNSKLIPALL